ncbi:MAG: PSD1 and planctomycete cytochrome C domain-containing protein [Mariniblastus sp.]|nr:PSD1 and planctomycete cytochrome C domain-containing protein [Mariniblastus sp.]
MWFPLRIPIRLIAITALALSPLSQLPLCFAQSDPDFFESNVRPLLVKHCQSCHGEKKQESGLRLDTREGWRRGGDRGAAIVAGEAAQSLLIQAVKHEDADLQMPPDQRLTEREIAILETWVERGAFDPRTDTALAPTQRMSLEEAASFWSFQPVQKRDPPPVESADWSENPIDAFVLNEMQAQQLTPMPLADRRTLIRRATFDLTGLPPTRQEVETFLNDRSDDAFASLVDRLLASPAYGERWGRHWLDVARYADTAGDGADYPVPEATRYRDWVIEAFNTDKPYDEFVREQIAGDILARDVPQDEYAGCVTATGFLAVGKRYGYKASPDYQYLDFADVIDSVGRSFLGLSLGCARCHDHKYDPVSAADYYALYGILQSSRWAFPGGEEQKRPAHFVPLVPPERAVQLETAKQANLAKLAERLADLKTERAELDPAFLAGGVDLGFESQAGGQPLGEPWVSAGPVELTVEAQSPYDHVHPAGKLGVRLGSGLPTDGLRYVFAHGLRATVDKQMHFTVDFRPVASSTQAGAFRLYLGRGVVQSLAVECSATSTEFAIRNGEQWEVVRKLVPGTWYTLCITIDPATRTYAGIVGTVGDLTVFEKKATGPHWDGVVDCFICDAYGHVNQPACARDIDNVGLQAVAFGEPGQVSVAPRLVEPDTADRLAKIDLEINELTAGQQSVSAAPAFPVAYAVTEGTPVNARLQQRGEPHRLGDEIPRRNLELFGSEPIADPSGSGRLDLADWLTRPTNPLTARVFVNRVWHWHFGQGIVATPSDFGSRGTRPTHPELLDWLANEFVEAGWSVKALHRRIMNSRTYQLVSQGNEANLAIDPQNRYHWRFPRRHLDAESIRDAVLATSGQLDRTVPGRHPFPPVTSWNYTIHDPFHAIYDSNHRSVYLMLQRNRRHPYLALFDAADPNQSVATRRPTMTSTQALFLLNSPFIHEQAEHFAQRIVSVSGDDRAKVTWAFETSCGVKPETEVVEQAVRFLTDYREKRVGKDDPGDTEIAAWAALSRVLLTSNAFLFVD